MAAEVTENPSLATESSDEDILFERIFKDHYKAVLGLFRRKGFQIGEAEDLAQSVFIRLYRNFYRFKIESGSLSVWVHVIALNVWRNELRFRSAHTGRELLLSFDGSEHLDELTPVSPDDSQRALLESERRQLLRQAIDELVPRQRQILLLRMDDELPLREIAAQLRMSVDSVKASLYQARRSLRARLAPSFAERVDREDRS
jgi:RNA polymerase sigma-70 factor, ECF subfamily